MKKQVVKIFQIPWLFVGFLMHHEAESGFLLSIIHLKKYSSDTHLFDMNSSFDIFLLKNLRTLEDASDLELNSINFSLQRKHLKLMNFMRVVINS